MNATSPPLFIWQDFKPTPPLRSRCPPLSVLSDRGRRALSYSRAPRCDVSVVAEPDSGILGLQAGEDVKKKGPARDILRVGSKDGDPCGYESRE